MFQCVAIGSRLFHVVFGCCRLLYDVSFVLGCATLLGFFRMFLAANCVSIFWGCSHCFFGLFVDCVQDVSVVFGCLGRFGPDWDVLVVLGCLELRSDVF